MTEIRPEEGRLRAALPGVPASVPPGQLTTFSPGASRPFSSGACHSTASGSFRPEEAGERRPSSPCAPHSCSPVQLHSDTPGARWAGVGCRAEDDCRAGDGRRAGEEHRHGTGCRHGNCTQGVRELAGLLNSAASVTFFCGAGCAGAREPLVALAGRVQAPIAYTLAAKDEMEAENPYAIGMSGPLGWGDAGHALKNCELLVLWGTDFPFRNYLPQHGRVAQIDADPAALGRRVPLSLGIVGDVGKVARELLPLIKPHRPEEHLARSLARHGKALSRMHARLCPEPGERVDAAYLTRLVSSLAEPDAIFCLGLGSPLTWGSRYLQAQRRQRMHTPAIAGSLIGELLQARRSKEAEPGRQVIALCDDNMRETLRRELPALWHDGLAVKVLLYAHNAPQPDELPGSELLEWVEQAPRVVRRWLAARRASLLTALVPLLPSPDQAASATQGGTEGR